MDYDEFIANKQFEHVESGFEPNELSDQLFGFQRDIVNWACRRGRAAIFADTGLGKTIMELEWARQVYIYTSKPVLIVTPLCVAQQHVREAGKFGLDCRYLRNQDKIDDSHVIVTNYEMLDKFDLSAFAGLVLDESSAIKDATSKRRNQIIELSHQVPYRLSCTATPSPNDHMELGNQAEFLGVMKQTEMLAMFFTHDSSETQKWRLKGHAKSRFWEWMAGWSVCIRKPSDLGHNDDGYILPGLELTQHEVESDKIQEGQLFVMEAQTLFEQRKAQRDSIPQRVERVAELVNNSGEQWIVWCHLNDESDRLVKAIPGAESVKGSDDIDDKEDRMLRFMGGSLRVLVSKPSIMGHGLNMQNCHNMAFVGLSNSFEQYYQAVRRCYRFGQQKIVNVHIVTAQAEGSVKQNIERKQHQANEMSESMVAHMRTMMKRNVSSAIQHRDMYNNNVTMIIPRWITEEVCNGRNMEGVA